MYYALKKAGPLRNGNERGKGSIFHAVEAWEGGSMESTAGSGRTAMCGQRPAIMWSSAGNGEVTCPRCRSRLSRTRQLDLVAWLDESKP